jgi:hypothetical protein
MSNGLTIQGLHGTYPNVEALGFRDGEWRRVAKLIENLADLRRKARQNGARVQELQHELKFQQERFEEEQTQAVLEGTEPPTEAKYIKSTEKELAKARAREKAFRKGSEKMDAELQRYLSDKAPVLSPEVDRRLLDIIRRREDLLAEVQRLEDSLGALKGVEEILTGERVVRHYSAYSGREVLERGQSYNTAGPMRVEDFEDDAIMSAEDRARLAAYGLR